VGLSFSFDKVNFIGSMGASANTGIYAWTVPYFKTAKSQVWIRIAAAGINLADTSGPFSVAAAQPSRTTIAPRRRSLLLTTRGAILSPWDTAARIFRRCSPGIPYATVGYRAWHTVCVGEKVGLPFHDRATGALLRQKPDLSSDIELADHKRYHAAGRIRFAPWFDERPGYGRSRLGIY
jgi:hypothetical protein